MEVGEAHEADGRHAGEDAVNLLVWGGGDGFPDVAEEVEFLVAGCLLHVDVSREEVASAVFLQGRG